MDCILWLEKNKHCKERKVQSILSNLYNKSLINYSIFLELFKDSSNTQFKKMSVDVASSGGMRTVVLHVPSDIM